MTRKDVRTAIRSLAYKALTRRLKGQYQDAEALYGEALALAEENFGPKEAALAQLLNDVAVLYKYTGRFGDARRLYLQALRIVKAIARRTTRIWPASTMIAYRAESSLVSLLRQHLARSDDARPLVPAIFETEADLLPDLNAKTLTVRIHHLTQAAHDQVLQKLCSTLNETQTVFPGTDLTLFFKTGSS